MKLEADALQPRGEAGLAELIRAHDWNATALGPPANWPAPLRMAVRLILNTRHPMYIMWGPELICFYNDAFSVSLGPEWHPRSLGLPARIVWADVWHTIGPELAHVMAGHGAIWRENAFVPVNRFGESAEVYWTYSTSPIDDPAAATGVGGVLVICSETTDAVQQQRRQAILLQLSDRIRDLSAPLAIMAAAAEALLAELRVSRVGYGEVDETQANYVVPHECTDGSVPPMAGRHRLAGLGRGFLAELQAGHTVSVADIDEDKRAAEGAEGHRAAGTVGLVVVPLIRAGRLRGSLHVCSGRARRWSAGEISLIEEVAQRTWAALERARAEEQQLRLLALIEHSDDLIATADPDGRIMYINAGGRRMIGLAEKAEPHKLTFSTYVAPCSQTLFRTVAVPTARSEGLWEGRMRFVHTGTGALMDVQSTIFAIRGPKGEMRGFATVAHDLTAARAAEAALAEREALFRATFEQAPIGVAHVAPDGRWLRVNARLCAMLGYTRDEMLSRSFQDITHPDDVGPDLEHVRALLSGETSAYAMEKRYIRKDGSFVWSNLTVSLLRDASGTPANFVSLIEDISIRKSYEAELDKIRGELEQRVSDEVQAREAAQARLAQAQRMEALGQLAGGIAHDVNNIIQAVQGGAGLIRKRRNDPVATDHLARMIEDAARRGASVTRRLLAFARRDELQAETVEPAGLLSDLRDMLSHTVGSDIAVRLEIARPEPQSLRADKGQLETVLVNLATNARDAMPDGGMLTLSACDELIAPEAGGAGFLAPGRYVRLAVSDTGLGMTPDVLARAAEPFFTTKPVGKGTGLGLAMARGFAEQSGGALAIQSVPGAGTTITLWLPVAGSQHPALPALSDQKSAHVARRILVVDDEALVREVVAEGLRELGFATLRASDGYTALAIMDAGTEFDLLLTDHAMPGMDGVTLVREARRRRPSLPAILLTGNADSHVEIRLAHEGLAGGAFSLMRKPVGAEQLGERVASLLKEHENTAVR